MVLSMGSLPIAVNLRDIEDLLSGCAARDQFVQKELCRSPQFGAVAFATLPLGERLGTLGRLYIPPRFPLHPRPKRERP
jgi:hypothetical protein